MALLQNGTLFAQYPRAAIGGGVAADVCMFSRANRFNRFTGETYLRTSATPNGHLAPSAWVLPIKAGGLSSYTPITGSGGVTFAQSAAGLNAQAGLTGDGGVTLALLALVTSAIANLSGTSSVTLTLTGKLQAAATLAGAGNVAGAIGAIASLLASVSGTGNATAQPYARAFADANIRGYSDLTPEGIKDAIWGASAAANNAAGTMGQKLNSAASGGVDYTALAGAVRTELQAELLRIIEIAKLHGLVIGSDLVVTETTRTAGTVVQSISTAAGTTTVQRQP